MLVGAVRHVGRRQIGERRQQVIARGLPFGFLGAGFINAHFQRRNLLDQAIRFCVVLLRLGLANRLRRRIARRLRFLFGGGRGAQFGVRGDDRRRLRRQSAARPGGVINGGVVTEGADIVHGRWLV